MDAIRKWFLRHWFAGVFLIIGAVWVITTVAYVSGAKNITFANRYGKPATIEFMRQYDHPAVGLGEGLGLELDERGPHLHGTVVKLEPGLPVFCLLCGANAAAGGLARVDFRQGDWFFRAPEDLSRNSEARNGRPQSRDFILTIAYNRATGERVLAGVDDSLGRQEQTLAGKGLAATGENRLTLESISDLPALSMQKEGCVIVQAAFVAAALLWLLLGGLSLVSVRLFRKK